MPLKRFHDWHRRLDRFIDSRRDLAFQWGKNDCALFAADAVEAMTGTDLAKDLRGYTTEMGALKAVKAFAGAGLRELAEKIAAEQGIGSIKPTFAQRGDVVLLPGDQGETLGVVSLDGRYSLSVGPKGLFAGPTLKAIAAWRI